MVKRCQDNDDRKDSAERLDAETTKEKLMDHALLPYVLKANNDLRGDSTPYTPIPEVWRTRDQNKEISDFLLNVLKLREIQVNRVEKLTESAQSFCDKLLETFPKSQHITKKETQKKRKKRSQSRSTLPNLNLSAATTTYASQQTLSSNNTLPNSQLTYPSNFSNMAYNAAGYASAETLLQNPYYAYMAAGYQYPGYAMNSMGNAYATASSTDLSSSLKSYGENAYATASSTDLPSTHALKSYGGNSYATASTTDLPNSLKSYGINKEGLTGGNNDPVNTAVFKAEDL